MAKTILLTGATDGIGRAALETLTAQGHKVLIHGRSQSKLDATMTETGAAAAYRADFSDLTDVAAMAAAIREDQGPIDVLINNAGVYKTSQPLAQNGQDVRFIVNTLAPALLTQDLMPILAPDARILNLSSAAQAPVNLAALKGEQRVGDMDAYAQSKLAITMWSYDLAEKITPPQMSVAINPGSLLATKMVKEGFGVAGSDISIGANLLVAMATSPDFASANGTYFDNDARSFGPPHPDALDPAKRAAVVAEIEALIA